MDEYCVASVTPLERRLRAAERLAQLRMREPVAKIGWTMYVYDLRKKKSPAR